MQAVEVVTQLLRGEVRSPSLAQPPKMPGFYAWWCRRAQLGTASPAIPYEARSPISSDWSLLYVGISPDKPSSNRNIAIRFSKDHSGGNIGGSTFRKSLAALMMGGLRLEPLRGPLGIRKGSDRSPQPTN